MVTDRADQLRKQLEVRQAVADTLDAIEAGQMPSLPLSELSQQLVSGDSPASLGDDRWALAEALRSLGMAASWEPSVEAADRDASRYAASSRHIAGKALRSDRTGTWSDAVIEALTILARLEGFDAVPQAAASLKCAPVVFATTDLLAPMRPGGPPNAATQAEVTPTVLLHFTLNDAPVLWPMALQTGVLYRLGASAAVDEWPSDPAEILIEWQSTAAESILEREGFTILADGETTDTGYLLARAEIPPGQGIDLTPVVTIRSADGNQYGARVVGQRSLRVSTFAPSDIGAGLPMVEQRIVELLGEASARVPSLPRADRLNLLHLLDATSRFAALAIEQEELRSIDEKGFQRVLKQALLMDPRIGGRIQEGTELGGGETDLVLERIVNELKVSPAAVDFESAQRFIGQPTQYASAGDCPISVLTILDQSEKSEPPGIQSNYMRWAYPQIHVSGPVHTPSMVAVIIIPVGFPIPSQWSRTPTRATAE